MSSEQKIVVVEDPPKRERAVSIPPSADANTALLQVIAAAARDPQVDVAKMQALYAMHKDAVDRQAAVAFATAMAEFKANPPKIIKDTHVKIQHKNGPGFTEYDHASLGHVCDAIIAGLAAVGISHRWDLEQLDGGMIRVTCVLTHAAGHSTRTSLQSSRDDSGSKNNIQAVGSTQSYLSRYTLLAATGLAAGLPDDDGASAQRSTVEAPPFPEGYESWSADMDAKADEGKAKHHEAWGKSPQAFRDYATRHDVQWWTESKARAARAGA